MFIIRGLPDRVNRNLLLAHERIEGVLHKCPSSGSGGLLENVIQVLNMITTTNTNELKDWLVLLERQIRLIACFQLTLDNTEKRNRDCLLS